MISLNKLLIVTFIISSVIIYFYLPELIPTHWGVNGQIDQWGPSWVSLLIPLMVLVFYVLWKWIPKIAVFKKNIKNLGNKYHYFLTALILFFLVVYSIIVASAFGLIMNIKYLIIPSLTLLFLYISTMLSKVKRNFFIGIRNPWTLSSDKSWKKTHEKAARAFQIYALLFLTLLIIPPEYIIWIILIPLIALLLYLTIYSYKEWKKDKKAIKE